MPTLQFPSRVYAAVYDKVNASAEEAGVSGLRRELIATATGSTIEIGTGTGVNLEHYPAAVTRLVLTEPDENMRKRLEAKLRETERSAEVLPERADALSAGDATFDTAVCTMVLCTVPDPAVALAEIQRVLKPGGRFLFLEHVRSDRPAVARLQTAARPVYWVMGRGCHPNRDTLAAIEAAGFEIEAQRQEIAPKTPPTENTLLIGSARRPA